MPDFTTPPPQKHMDQSFWSYVGFSGRSDEQMLYRRLNSRVIKPHESTQLISMPSFLPISAIDEIGPEDITKPKSPFFSSLFCSAPDSSQVVEKAKKLFAVLTLCDKEDTIWDLFNDGLTDGDLPLEQTQADGRDGSSSTLVSCQDRCKSFQSFSRFKDIEINNFLKRQWLVLAPVLTTQGGHNHIAKDVPLPIYDISIKSPGVERSVYKGTLHAAHILPKARADVHVAVKIYTTEKDFNREKENLEVTQDLNHSHLIQHIATVQRGGIFYVIFPWAQGGSLSDFWKRDPGGLQIRKPTIVLWCFQQMLGLVDAIRGLHGRNVRHGDLKPENVLHFKASADSPAGDDQYGTLVLADVGISRYHEEITERRKMATTTNATTPSYEAPEAEFNQEDPRSRKYDMWSVGCVFMEFLIWLLYGHQAICDFRKRQRPNAYRQNAAYYIQSDLENTAVRNPAVCRGIEVIKNDPRCTGDTGLIRLISLIDECLIVIDPKERATSEELRDNIQDIVRRAETDPDYLIRGLEPPPEIPGAFRPSDNGHAEH
ncbi:kinase-like protein [Nemania sp. FL0916]|nr:kinase-like protein [Nemania sp. FL0916]